MVFLDTQFLCLHSKFTYKNNEAKLNNSPITAFGELSATLVEHDIRKYRRNVKKHKLSPSILSNQSKYLKRKNFK